MRGWNPLEPKPHCAQMVNALEKAARNAANNKGYMGQLTGDSFVVKGVMGTKLALRSHRELLLYYRGPAAWALKVGDKPFPHGDSKGAKRNNLVADLRTIAFLTMCLDTKQRCNEILQAPLGTLLAMPLDRPMGSKAPPG